MGKKNNRKMNAARVCFGISRIGYTPANALCDIIDNAVSAHAKNIHVVIVKKNNNFNNNKRDNVEEYLIIDDGDGMSREQIGNALDLGSSEANYEKGTLSKFGLGLKSASFAQGDRLEIISGDTKAIQKEYVDLSEMEGEYYSVEDDVSDVDRKLVEKYFADKKRGTIIRITKIHKNNHPSIKSTIDELKEKIGVIYYYFLEKDIHIFVNDEKIPAFDPLFVKEAGENNLDENLWDGKSVQWLLRPTDIMLDSNAKINGKVEITMLPHPKVQKKDGVSDLEIRNRYHISAQNYGFYVYRNKRLINWANKLDIIPFDQDYYAFRGRINIQADADDAFNIDVSKSRIILSEDAKDALDDFVSDYKRKCKVAWNNAWNKYQALISADSNDVSNDITSDLDDVLDSDFYDDDSEEFSVELKRREEEIDKESRKKDICDTLSRKRDEGCEAATPDTLTDDDIAETMKGKSNVSDLDKIFKVSAITDNELWEPYVDAEKKECVRISTSHRFSKVIYENNSDNKDLQVFFELLMYIEAKAELQIRKQYHDIDLEKLTEVLEEYRLVVSEKLAKMCRKGEEKLPPYTGEK